MRSHQGQQVRKEIVVSGRRAAVHEEQGSAASDGLVIDERAVAVDEPFLHGIEVRLRHGRQREKKKQ
jgi:hypothetical protein